MKTGFASFFAGLFFLACLAYPASAFGQELQFRVTVQVANIRLEPTASSPVIGQVKAGTVLEVIEAGEWVRIYLPVERDSRRIGYIAGWLGKLETIRTIPSPSEETGFRPAVKPEPEPRAEPVRAKSEPVQSPSQPVPQPVVQIQPGNPNSPGRFGAGLQFAATPGGAVPSVLYDLNDRLTLNAAVGLYSGVTGMMGEILYRFPQPSKNPPSDMTFEPYVGGGLVFVSVRYGFGLASESYTGFIGSGGTFLTFKKIPRWRFGGDISLVQFSIEGIAVAGVGVRLGFHYFF